MILLAVESDSSAGRLLSLTVLPAAAGESGARLFVICPCIKTNAFSSSLSIPFCGCVVTHGGAAYILFTSRCQRIPKKQPLKCHNDCVSVSRFGDGGSEFQSQTRDSVLIHCLRCLKGKATLLQMMRVYMDGAVCLQHHPRIPPGPLLNTVNKPVKKTKIRAALKTTSCWSLGSPAPLHVGLTAAGGAALCQADSLRAPAECLPGSRAWRSGGKKVCFFYWGGSLFSREQKQKNKIERRLLC